jgi:uncharacterized membrane-anchored protein
LISAVATIAGEGKMYRIALAIALQIAAFTLIEQRSFAQESNSLARDVAALGWVNGPSTVPTVGNAKISLPSGYNFLNAADTDKLMVLMQNPPSGQTENLVAPADLSWYAILSSTQEGYVKDDEKIDPDAILDNYKKGTEAANVERRKNGWAELHVTGWRREPYYDATTNQLEWAMDASSGEGVVVNFETRILGRKGFTSAVLVTDPEHFQQHEREFKNILAGYSFNPGEKYSDFRQGDKVAAYGLGALILGGAAAAVVKSGILAKFAKVIFFGGIALVAGLFSMIRRFFSRRQA